MLKQKFSFYRRQRKSHFLRFLRNFETPIRILDIGGLEEYWQSIGMLQNEDYAITLLNISYSQEPKHLPYLIGDARDLSRFTEDSFDIVFSNSVIEHVGHYQDQFRMAQEVQRVGKSYYIQTPNKFFPIEIHFFFPLFALYPRKFRLWLVKNGLTFSYNSQLGQFTRRRPKDQAAAEMMVDSIRLLNKKEVQELFPKAFIYEEKIGPFIKSFTMFDQLAV